MRLNELSDNPGATKARKRVGRGIGSGKGKTAGRGVKGQKSRSGVSINGFEGGQMPIHMRLPKRGFNKPNRKRYAELSIATLERAVQSGKIKAGEKLDAEALVRAGVIRRAHDGVRIIGNGELSQALDLHVASATKGAQGIVEGAKGSITVVEGKPARVTRDKGVVASAAKTVKKTAKKAVAKTAKAVEAAAEAVSDAADAVADTAGDVAEAAAPEKADAKKAPAKKAAAKKSAYDYLGKTQDFDADADEAVIAKIEKYLGASLSNKDAKFVSCGDESELETIAKGFMKKKLGVEDKAEAMEKVKAVCEQMKPHRMKNRVTFYYLLAKNEGKLGEF
ncbi:MAG: 50S ribosomal protein L15 [Pseudomonadota bacterium]